MRSSFSYGKSKKTYNRHRILHALLQFLTLSGFLDSTPSVPDCSWKEGAFLKNTLGGGHSENLSVPPSRRMSYVIWWHMNALGMGILTLQLRAGLYVESYRKPHIITFLWQKYESYYLHTSIHIYMPSKKIKKWSLSRIGILYNSIKISPNKSYDRATQQIDWPLIFFTTVWEHSQEILRSL